MVTHHLVDLRLIFGFEREATRRAGSRDSARRFFVNLHALASLPARAAVFLRNATQRRLNVGASAGPSRFAALCARAFSTHGTEEENSMRRLDPEGYEGRV